MSFITSPYTLTQLRNTNYNRSVLLTEDSLEDMMNGFDGIFDNILNFTEQISSLQVYPFPIKADDDLVRVLSVNNVARLGVASQIISYDNTYMSLGEFHIEPYFNNFADYNGYTKISVFLPLLGYVDVDTNECMNKWLQVRLCVDYFTGKGIYILGVSDESITQDFLADYSKDLSIRILSSYETDVGVQIPLGTSNAGEIRRNLALSAVKIAASLAFTPSITPAVTTKVETSTKTYDIKGARKAKNARLKQIKAGTVTTEKESTTTKTGGTHKYDLTDAFNDSIDVLSSIKLTGGSDRVNDSGLTTRFSGTAKVVIYRPKLLDISNEQKHLYGVPLGRTMQLDLLHGYTEISRAHFEGDGFSSATTAEMAEINDAFMNGVILP